jgi:hypothetical protein
MIAGAWTEVGNYTSSFEAAFPPLQVRTVGDEVELMGAVQVLSTSTNVISTNLGSYSASPARYGTATWLAGASWSSIQFTALTELVVLGGPVGVGDTIWFDDCSYPYTT